MGMTAVGILIGCVIAQAEGEPSDVQFGRAVSSVCIVNAQQDGESSTARGVLLGDNIAIVPWNMIERADSVTVTLACCDTPNIEEVVGASPDANLLWIRLSAGPANHDALPIAREAPRVGETVWIMAPVFDNATGPSPAIVADAREYPGEGSMLLLDWSADDVFGNPTGAAVINAAGELCGVWKSPAGFGRSFVSILTTETVPANGFDGALKQYHERTVTDAERAWRVWADSAKTAPGREPAMLEKAVQLNPSLWRAWYSLAVNRDERGEHESALNAIDESIRVEPTYFRSHFSRGLILMRLERWDDAATAHRKAIALFDQFTEARAMLCLSLAYGDEVDLAATEALLLLEADDLNSNHLQIAAYALDKAGKLEESRPALERAWKHISGELQPE